MHQDHRHRVEVGIQSTNQIYRVIVNRKMDNSKNSSLIFLFRKKMKKKMSIMYFILYY